MISLLCFFFKYITACTAVGYCEHDHILIRHPDDLEYKLEGVSLSGLLNGAKDILIHAEGQSDAESGQRQVSHDAQYGEQREGQQEDHEAAKHDPRLLDVPPVDKVHH